ncbi:MAG: polyhydroxyalkanoate depolymerase, partial [Mesorhizobium sp.]
MLYQAYQLQDDLIAPARMLAELMGSATAGMALGDAAKRPIAAGLEMITRFRLTHTRPDFGIETVRVGHREVPVAVETAL